MFESKFHFAISHDTVANRLHERGYSFQKRRIVQFLTPEQISTRFYFCQNMLENYNDMLQNIIFSDESRFCSSPDNQKMRMKEDDFSELTQLPLAKNSLRTMEWGAIGLNYKSKLFFHDSSVDVNEYYKYLNRTEVFKELNEKFGEGKYIFQQDGATCHNTREIINYINNNARCLHGLPPNSPDLSPIEMIWAHMKAEKEGFP